MRWLSLEWVRMEQDTSHGPDFGLPDSVTDLLSLQNGAVAGEAGSMAASSQVLSQGDLEALASIQEELDKFGSASGKKWCDVENKHIFDNSDNNSLLLQE